MDQENKVVTESLTEADFISFRHQILAIDLIHHVLIVVAILIQLGLCIATQATGNAWYACWVPLFVVTMLGLIMRMDTMIHRIGGFLKAHGDRWEYAKAGHRPTKILMPWADGIVMVPVLTMLVYAEYRACLFLESPTSIIYVVVTLVLVGFGIFGWITAATKASSGFDGK